MKEKRIDVRRKADITAAMDRVLAAHGSQTLCSAKWLQSTTNLYNGTTHSCHHCPRHAIDVEELKHNPKALHNTPEKAEQRVAMLSGKRPSECGFCWSAEDNGGLSDRFIKTTNTEWSMQNLDRINTVDPEPAYFEVAFDTTCNLTCLYCTPAVSSKWFEEISRNGHFNTSRHYNSLGAILAEKEFPIPANQYNPYKEAFWKWWPELKFKLTNFRITGGEPLMSKDVWRILDDLIAEPVPDLNLVINTNLSTEPVFFERLVDKVQQLEGKLRLVQLATSAEAKGAQCEFIRHGMSYDLFMRNQEDFLARTESARIVITATVNVLSIFTMDQFLEDYSRLKDRYGLRVMLSIPHVHYPEFMNIKILPPELLQPALDRIQAWGENRGSNIERELIARLISYALDTHPKADLHRRDLKIFLEEWQERKPTEIWKPLFPELASYL